MQHRQRTSTSPAAGEIRGDSDWGTGDQGTLHLDQGWACRALLGHSRRWHGAGGPHPRDRVSLRVVCVWCRCKLGSRASPGGDGWWEMARQEAFGKESVWCLSHCQGLASPNGFSLHASPFPASSAGSEHLVCTHSSSGTLPQVPHTAGEAALAPLLGSLFCCSISGRKVPSREETRGKEETSFLFTPKPAGKTKDILLGWLGRDSVPLAGQSAGLGYWWH